MDANLPLNSLFPRSESTPAFHRPVNKFIDFVTSWLRADRLNDVKYLAFAVKESKRAIKQLILSEQLTADEALALIPAMRVYLTFKSSIKRGHVSMTAVTFNTSDLTHCDIISRFLWSLHHLKFSKMGCGKLENVSLPFKVCDGVLTSLGSYVSKGKLPDSLSIGQLTDLIYLARYGDIPTLMSAADEQLAQIISTIQNALIVPAWYPKSRLIAALTCQVPKTHGVLRQLVDRSEKVAISVDSVNWLDILCDVKGASVPSINHSVVSSFAFISRCKQSNISPEVLSELCSEIVKAKDEGQINGLISTQPIEKLFEAFLLAADMTQQPFHQAPKALPILFSVLQKAFFDKSLSSTNAVWLVNIALEMPSIRNPSETRYANFRVFESEAHEKVVSLDSLLICAKSQFFRALLLGSLKEAQNPEREIQLLDRTVEDLAVLEEWFLTGTIKDLENIETAQLEHLYALLDWAQIDGFTDQLEQALRHALTRLNLSACLHLASSQNLPRLLERCIEFINTNCQGIEVKLLDNRTLDVQLALCHDLDSSLRQGLRLLPISRLKLEGALSYPHSPYPSDGIQLLSEGIRELDIAGCPDITDEDLLKVIRHCPMIEVLTISQFEGVTRRGWDTLKNLSNLKRLGIDLSDQLDKYDDRSINQLDLGQLQHHLPLLTTVSVSSEVFKLHVADSNMRFFASIFPGINVEAKFEKDRFWIRSPLKTFLKSCGQRVTKLSLGSDFNLNALNWITLHCPNLVHLSVYLPVTPSGLEGLLRACKDLTSLILSGDQHELRSEHLNAILNFGRNLSTLKLPAGSYSLNDLQGLLSLPKLTQLVAPTNLLVPELTTLMSFLPSNSLFFGGISPPYIDGLSSAGKLVQINLRGQERHLKEILQKTDQLFNKFFELLLTHESPVTAFLLLGVLLKERLWISLAVERFPHLFQALMPVNHLLDAVGAKGSGEHLSIQAEVLRALVNNSSVLSEEMSSVMSSLVDGPWHQLELVPGINSKVDFRVGYLWAILHGNWWQQLDKLEDLLSLYVGAGFAPNLDLSALKEVAEQFSREWMDWISLHRDEVQNVFFNMALSEFSSLLDTATMRGSSLAQAFLDTSPQLGASLIALISKSTDSLRQFCDQKQLLDDERCLVVFYTMLRFLKPMRALLISMLPT